MRRLIGKLGTAAALVAFGALVVTGFVFGMFSGGEEIMLAGVMGMPNPLRRRVDAVPGAKPRASAPK